jgi:hypothetical protein
VVLVVAENILLAQNTLRQLGMLLKFRPMGQSVSIWIMCTLVEDLQHKWQLFQYMEQEISQH